MIFIGYPERHSSSSYRMYNVGTGVICISRDIYWLNKNYIQWKDDQRNIDGIVTTTGLLSLDNVSTFKDNETSQNSETKRVNSTVHKSITNISIYPQNILNSRLRSEVMKTRSQSNVNYTLVSK